MADDPRSTEEEVALPPPMPVRTTLYFTPDGQVRFGAMFADLVPVAKALDPTLDLQEAAPALPDSE